VSIGRHLRRLAVESAGQRNGPDRVTIATGSDFIGEDQPIEALQPTGSNPQSVV
jgi:hypothetical protein